jgi:beta-mannosidase
MSNLSSIRTVLSPENQKVTTMGDNLVWRHHGEWWDTYAYREKPLFGEIGELDELCDLSQYLQAEGIRYAVEAHRRRAKTSRPVLLAPGETDAPPVQESVGAIVWQLNEPWPNVSCTSMADYYGNPKLALFFWRDAEDPLRLTLRYDKLVWSPGEQFEGRAFLCDDRQAGVESLSATAYGDGFSLLPQADNEPFRIPAEYGGNRIRFPVPRIGESFAVVCEARERGGSEKTHRAVYLFLIGKENALLPRGPVLRFVREYRAVYGKEM